MACRGHGAAWGGGIASRAIVGTVAAIACAAAKSILAVRALALAVGAALSTIGCIFDAEVAGWITEGIAVALGVGYTACWTGWCAL